ncbi:MAG: SDR family oxidoreductase [Desulfobacterales bacterium]|jgi:NAD(P)-dependent dehydrogenase (short-subunit alcohol dehydrogenase family)
MPLKEKKAVVIGGSSGIGLAVAKVLVNSGARVVIASRSSNKLTEAQRTIGANTLVYQLDVTQEERVQKFFKEIGSFDHLVCTAVSGINAPFLEMDTDDAKAVFKTKFWGQYYAAKHGAPKIRPGGSITLFSGIASHKPVEGLSAIAAANGAVEALARSLAVELGPIRVNTVLPAVISTPQYDRMPDDKRNQYLEHYGAKLPVKRPGNPDDVAATVLYLILNLHTTGTLAEVNGGYRLV